MKVLIVHGTRGNPNGAWIPWLKNELEILGCKVFAPQFPTPEGQSLENWLKISEKDSPYDLVIGHSIGAAFLLSLIEQAEKPVSAAFLVAGFIGLLNIKEFDDLNYTISDKNFDWEKIKKNCRSFFVFNSDNDPYIPLEKGRELAKNIGTELILVKGGGHLNLDSGYHRFPLILEKIKENLQLPR